MIGLLWLQACTFVLLCACRVLGGEPREHIDVSYLPFDDEIRELISENIPDELDSLFTSSEWGVDPQVLANYIRVSRYHVSASDSSSRYLLIYISDGLGAAALQAYKSHQEKWSMISELKNVSASYLTRILEVDVDCDGANEIMLKGAVGAGALVQIDFVKFQGERLSNITPQLMNGETLFGRSIQLFQSGSACLDSVLIDVEDGPNRFEVTKKRWYKFDSVTKALKLTREVPVGPKD